MLVEAATAMYARSVKCNSTVSAARSLGHGDGAQALTHGFQTLSSALPASVWTGTAYSLPLSLALTQTEGALWTLRRTRVQAAKGTSISPSGEDRRPFSCMPSSVPSHSSCQVLRLNRISHHCLRNKIPAQLTTGVFLSASSTGKTVH